MSKILGYKFNHSSRVDSVLAGFIHTTYVAVHEEEVNLCEIVHTQLLDNISKMKASRRTIFRFGSLLTHIFFYGARRFLGISHWDRNECLMQTVTRVYRGKLETVRDNDIDRMMKGFHVEMKKRYRIPPSLVEKYKEDIFFMVEIEFTCMKAIIPRMKFIGPMGYEMSTELIEGYAQIIL